MNKHDFLVLHFCVVNFSQSGGVTPHKDLCGEAPRERGTFCRLQVYKRVEISLAEVYERIGKCVILVNKKAQKD